MSPTSTSACSRAVASRSATTTPFRRSAPPRALPHPGSIRIPVPLSPRALQRGRCFFPPRPRLAPIRALEGLPDASKLPTNSSSSSDDDEQGDENDSQGNNNDSSEVAVLLAACGVGVATGLGVVLLNDAIDAVRALAWAGAPLEATHWGRWARSLPLEAALPLVLLPPTAAGLAVGALRAAAGGSLDDSRASGSSSRDIKVKAPLLRAAAAALSLGGGASLGPEGPAVDVGLSVARGTAAAFFPKDGGGNGDAGGRRRAAAAAAAAAEPLLAAGAGAGVAAGFGAPLSGAFFAVETVLLRRWSGERPSNATAANTGLAVSAILLAAVLAAVASSSGLVGFGLGPPRVAVPPYVLPSAVELPLALVLGALCGAVARGARRAERAAAAAALAAEEKAGFPAPLLPAVAGLLTGALALAYPEVLYQGFGNVNAILAAGVGSGGGGGGGGGPGAAATDASSVAAAAAAAARDGLFSSADGYGPSLLFQIAAAKVAATALCRGGRLVGGLYAPSILIGAALGGAYGGLLAEIADFSVGAAPNAAEPLFAVTGAPAAYALVGAAGMLSALCGVPLTAALLVFELTRDYLIVLPTLGAAAVAAWVASAGAGDSGGGRKEGGRGGSSSAAPAATAGSAVTASSSSFPSSSLSSSSPSSSGSPTALCAAGGDDSSCLVLPADMPLSAALALLEEEERDRLSRSLVSSSSSPSSSFGGEGGATDGIIAAVLLKRDGGVAGVLTLEAARAAARVEEEKRRIEDELFSARRKEEEKAKKKKKAVKR